MFNFFRKLFGRDDQIDFYARIYASLIISAGIPRSTVTMRTFRFCTTMFKDKDDRNFFLSRAMHYMSLSDKNEINLNQLIASINRLDRANPEWIAGLGDGAIAVCKIENGGLQDRVVEFLQLLKTPIAYDETKENKTLKSFI
ncbi:hypothetical protein AGMMS50229_06740 [Campylobacterota bacterium]|nr:hypothetical protein AGMMS50229_06740 [Campylobacterota bacterium]